MQWLNSAFELWILRYRVHQRAYTYRFKVCEGAHAIDIEFIGAFISDEREKDNREQKFQN